MRRVALALTATLIGGSAWAETPALLTYTLSCENSDGKYWEFTVQAVGSTIYKVAYSIYSIRKRSHELSGKIYLEFEIYSGKQKIAAFRINRHSLTGTVRLPDAADIWGAPASITCYRWRDRKI